MNSQFFIPDELARALGWTLAHSLWQGALAALVAAILLDRSTSARAKYRAAFASLVGVLAAAICTFSMVYEPAAADFAGAENFSKQISVVENQPPTMAELPVFKFDFLTRNMEQARQILEANFPVVVAAWIFGVLFFLLRLAGGLFFLKKICRSAQPVASDFQANFEKIWQHAAISRPVRLLETAILKSPATVGWLRPVILFPVGMVNQLSTAEVEAILAHELAHIARHDWLQNFAQALVEVLFFFHPAVWWMSAVVAAERENCCDDLALDLCGGSRLGYAKTLLRVQELAQNQTFTPNLALAFAKNQTGFKAIFYKNRPLLLERVRRILQPSTTKKFQVMERFAAAGLVLASLVLLAFRAPVASQVLEKISTAAAEPIEWIADVVAPEPAPEPADEMPALEALAQIGVDSLPKPKKQYRNYISDDGENPVEFRMEDEKITFLKIGGKEIAAAEYEKHRPMIEKIIAETPIPPVPLAPAAPGFPRWGRITPAEAPDAPDAPDAPHGFYHFDAPYPPASPSSAIVSSETDDEGNTTIIMERDGHPSEIVVKKSGEVFVDGKQMKKGEPIRLYGGDGDHHFFWPGDEGNQLIVAGDDAVWAPEGDPKVLKFKKKNYYDKAAAEQERAARRLERDARKLELEAEYHARRAEQEARLAEQRGSIEAFRAREFAQMHERMAAAGSSNFVDVMKNELHAEGILKDLKNFSLKMTQKSLKVDGKKQPEAVLQRMLELHRITTGKDFGDSKISIEHRD